MIAELSVENIAIIDRSRLELGPGFTVLTGETGAGKSLLVDAIELALGERAAAELVRAGSKSASVNVVFDLSAAPEARAKCAEMGIELEDGQLFITREIFAEGRSQCRMGGRLTPVSVLRQVGHTLVDLHGQHDHQSLLYPERHLAYLDDWIGKPAFDLGREVAAAFEEHRETSRRLEELRTGARDRERRLDLLQHQVNEIEAVNPLLGESEDVEGRLSRLQHAEKLAEAAFGALGLLAQDDQNATERLSGAVKVLEDAARYDAALSGLAAPLREALYQLEDATRLLGSYSAALESDPSALDELGNRLEALRRLRRKYGDDEAEVLEFLRKAREDLGSLESSDEQERQLAGLEKAALGRLQGMAEQLSALRKGRAAEFAGLVEGQLQDLSLERARFEVQFRTKQPDRSGEDDVEFLFTANPGEPLKPLSKIASGGEVSRLMLALKGVLAGQAGVPTLIFDEVDTGLGGRVAATVGTKLAALSKGYQVLVISHLPQVAAKADTHYKIEKLEHDGRVVTRVRLLSVEEREEEIARMLGGERVTPAALLNAKELLARD